MNALLQDFRYAVRQLTKSPGFTAVAVITLALGVGANTAVFSLANWILLRPTPGVRNEGQLATVWFPGGVSLPHYRAIAEQMPAFSATVGQDRTAFIVELRGQPAKSLTANVVTREYFAFLGASLGPGGPFTAEEVAAATGSPVVVISHRLWKESFGGDPGIVGRSIRLNAVTATITGVAARNFEGTAQPNVVDLWVPYTALVALARPGPFSAVREVPNFEDPARAVFQEFVGRLAPGASIQQAEVQLATAWARVVPEEIQRGNTRSPRPPTIRAGVGAGDFVRESASATIRVLAAVSGVLLVLAVANLVNLLVFRAVRRREELVVRRALGASASGLVRLSVVESLLLSLLAAGAAVLVAMGVLELFRGLSTRGLPAFSGVPLDGRVLGFGVLLSLAIGLLVGVLPPFLSGRVELATALRGSAAKASARRTVFRDVMTVVQLSACLSLLVGAFLLIGTLRNLQKVDLGFDAEHVSAFAADAGAAGYTPVQTTAFFDEAVRRVRSLPGVERVAMTPMAPFGPGNMFSGVWTDALPADRSRFPNTVFASADYFGVLGIQITRGRVFSEAEGIASGSSAPRVVIVSENLARQLFGGDDPLGRVVMLGRRPEGTPYRVVGVARDSRWSSVAGRGMGEANATIYRTLGDQTELRALRGTILIRSRAVNADLKKAAQAALADFAPSVPVVAEAMTERIDRTLAEQRLFARVVGLLTALAIALAGVGLYGLVGFSVAERRKEFGIRIALGAQGGEVLNLVVRHAAILATVGVAVGLAGAVGLSRMISSRLFGVAPLELFVYLGAIAVLILIVLVASLIPARAATRVDPMIALRSE